MTLGKLLGAKAPILSYAVAPADTPYLSGVFCNAFFLAVRSR